MRLAMLLIPALMILHDNAKKVIPVIDLTQAHTRETAIGVPGLSVSAISGEGISPGYSSLNIRVTLLRISTQAQSAVLEMQLRNIANSDVDIPLSTDQAAVQKAGTKHRITMDFMLVQAGRESQLGQTVKVLFGSNSVKGSIYTLKPNDSIDLKVPLDRRSGNFRSDFPID